MKKIGYFLLDIYHEIEGFIYVFYLATKVAIEEHREEKRKAGKR